ncbi:MAG: glycosyltransferase family 25 protein [Alphaproteobacteria bacterium]
MKIFVVSLKDAKQRRKIIASKMKKFGIQFEFFDAVDGRKELNKKYETMVDRKLAKIRLGREISNPEIGCGLSHAMVYKKMVQENIKNAIVLEDDVILDKDFAEMVNKSLCEKSNYDFIFLYHLYGRAMRFGKDKFLKDYNICKMAKTPNSTAGYYLNNKMANYLYKRVLPISWVADWNVKLDSMNTALIYPRIVRHPAIKNSLIESGRKGNKSRFGQFGFLYWVCYQFKKIFSLKVSEKVEGK